MSAEGKASAHLAVEHMAHTTHMLCQGLRNWCLHHPVRPKPQARCWHQVHVANSKHLTALHLRHIANRENIRLWTILETSTSKVSWAIANMSSSGTKCHLPADWQLVLSMEGIAGATCATDTEHCSVSMGCVTDCEL